MENIVYKNNLISKEAESIYLSENSKKFGYASLEINTNSEEELLDYLAELLTDIYFEKVYEKRKPNKIK